MSKPYKCTLPNGKCLDSKMPCAGADQKCGINYMPGTCEGGAKEGSKCWFHSDCGEGDSVKCKNGAHVNETCSSILAKYGKNLAQCDDGYTLGMTGGARTGKEAPGPCIFTCDPTPPTPPSMSTASKVLLGVAVVLLILSVLFLIHYRMQLNKK